MQAARHHHPMETSATVAQWDGDQLTLWDSVQASSTVVPVVRRGAARSTPSNVRVIAPHTGGGFGAKGYIWPHEILAAAAARIAGRPVKLQLRRVGPVQRRRLPAVDGADDPARRRRRRSLLGARARRRQQRRRSSTRTSSRRRRRASRCTPSPAIRLRQLIERVNLNVPTPMRAPVEGPGLWALESAMNELAESVGIDPLDLRLANFAETSPADGRPWSSNRLREAYEEGARRYGWRTRHDRPREDGPWRDRARHGHLLDGQLPVPRRPRGPAVARDGSAVVESNVHDIGSGAQTVLSQIAAEELGVPLDRVEMRWGDTDLPRDRTDLRLVDHDGHRQRGGRRGAGRGRSNWPTWAATPMPSHAMERAGSRRARRRRARSRCPATRR